MVWSTFIPNPLLARVVDRPHAGVGRFGLTSDGQNRRRTAKIGPKARARVPDRAFGR